MDECLMMASNSRFHVRSLMFLIMSNVNPQGISTERFLFLCHPHREAGSVSSESSSPRSDGDPARDGYRLFEVRHVTKEDGSVETWYR